MQIKQFVNIFCFEYLYLLFLMIKKAYWKLLLHQEIASITLGTVVGPWNLSF